MNYEALVPSRELCEELARLGICQDGAKLYWNPLFYGDGSISSYELSLNISTGDSIIAPTLPRMLEELPYRGRRGYQLGRNSSGEWYVCDDNAEEFIVHADTPSNAIAKALIAVKEAK